MTKAATVDELDPLTNAGYQRRPLPSRLRQAADYYVKGGRLPNPLPVNLRRDDLKKVELKVDDQRARDAAILRGGNGQHRNGAILVFQSRSVTPCTGHRVCNWLRP